MSLDSCGRCKKKKTCDFGDKCMSYTKVHILFDSQWKEKPVYKRIILTSIGESMYFLYLLVSDKESM